jgi:hypothetical protein
MKQAFFIRSNNVEENEIENNRTSNFQKSEDRTSNLQENEDRTSDLQTNPEQNMYLGCPNIVQYILALKVLKMFCHTFLKMRK